MSVKLVFYNNSYEPFLQDYYLPGPQMRFTATPKEANQYCKIEVNRYAVIVLKDSEIVSYFNLHTDEGVSPYTTNPNAILVRSFSTDYKQQGKGHAKEALQQLPSFLKEHFPNIDEIVLAVSYNNINAQKLYKKCGYEDHGERMEGRFGELFILHYTLL